MTVESGSHLGPYEILSAIGAGGMGERKKRLDFKKSQWGLNLTRSGTEELLKCGITFEKVVQRPLESRSPAPSE